MKKTVLTNKIEDMMEHYVNPSRYQKIVNNLLGHWYREAETSATYLSNGHTNRIMTKYSVRKEIDMIQIMDGVYEGVEEWKMGPRALSLSVTGKLRFKRLRMSREAEMWPSRKRIYSLKIKANGS